MPGTKLDYNEVVKAYKDGKVTKKQLLINATRIKKNSEKH